MTWQQGLTMGIGGTILTVLGFGLAIFLYTRIKERNEEEEKRMLRWNLTAKTIMSVSDWEVFFKKNNYKGDYFWFIP